MTRATSMGMQVSATRSKEDVFKSIQPFFDRFQEVRRSVVYSLLLRLANRSMGRFIQMCERVRHKSSASVRFSLVEIWSVHVDLKVIPIASEILASLFKEMHLEQTPEIFKVVSKMKHLTLWAYQLFSTTPSSAKDFVLRR
jgi:hypothetical protein